MAKVRGFIPVLRVDDLDKAIEFYVGVLGMTENWRWGDPPFYAGVSFGEDVQLHLNRVEDGAGTGELYVYVDDADSLHDEIKDKVTVEMQLKTQDYGMRDFSVRDPAGNFLTIGADAPQAPQG